MEITSDLVEQMVGQRTRLMQQPRSEWHRREDAALERYLNTCGKLDRSMVPLIAIVPRGWLVLALTCLAPRFLSTVATPVELAISLGGILLAQGALRRLTESLAHLSGSAIAWRQVLPLFQAATRTEEPGLSGFCGAPEQRQADDNLPLLEAHNLVFHHEGRAEKGLDACGISPSSGATGFSWKEPREAETRLSLHSWQECGSRGQDLL